MLKIVTICGSARRYNQTAFALAIAQDELNKIEDVDLITIEPDKMRLFIPGMESGPSDKDQLQDLVSSADGVLLATPEYHGSYSSLIKIVIENLGFPSAMRGKPVSLLGIAGGRIGAIKSLEHLRSVCAHIGALVLPGPISIAEAGKLFDEDGNCLDPKIETSIRQLAHRLVLYLRETRCPDVSMESLARRGTE